MAALTNQEIKEQLNLHAQKNPYIRLPDLFALVGTDLIENATKEYYDAKIYDSEENFQKSLIKKLKSIVKHFNADEFEGLAKCIYLDKTVKFSTNKIANSVNRIAKEHLSEENSEKFDRDFELNSKLVQLGRNGYRSDVNPLSVNFLNTYKFNLHYILRHEFLHAIKYQNKKYGLTNATISGGGLTILTAKKRTLSQAFFIIDEMINELHNVSFLSDRNDYKGSVALKVTSEPNTEYLIEKSYLSMFDNSTNIRSNFDKYLNADGKKVNFNCSYHRAINIGEMLELLVGKNQLFNYCVNDAFNFYNDFNEKYKQSFEKYFEKISSTSIYLKDKFNTDSKGSSLKMFDEMSKDFDVSEGKRLEPFDLLSAIVFDIIDKGNNQIKTDSFIVEQNLAQSVLLNCFSTKIENIKLNTDSHSALISARKEIKSTFNSVSKLVFKPTNILSGKKMTAEIELANLKNICDKKLAEIENNLYTITK